MIAQRLMSASGNKLDPAKLLAVTAYTGDGVSGRSLATGLDQTGGGLLIGSARNGSAAPWLKSVADLTVQWDMTGVGTAINYGSAGVTAVSRTGLTLSNHVFANAAATPYVLWQLARCQGFMDLVSYAGNGSVRTISHALGAMPRLLIVLCASSSTLKSVYHADLGASQGLLLGSTVNASAGPWNSTAPTANAFTVAADANVNGAGNQYLACLFAEVAGLSKIGSYNGTGNDLFLNLGFRPRLFLVKSSAGSVQHWLGFDTARGLIDPGNDPALYLDSATAEFNNEFLKPAASGVTLPPSIINVAGSTFIYIAMA
ncbi:DUF7483 domain-containing protein [Parachitinimonas caeni]|uniref:DUF7483 domain-containing protein n=1 Tax=Parachitinimonas caeni TaxID=3031301 RepID=A0ABT7DWQ7_9NEIS|nr:hypothetical protein [Parachitinimonas caeni]MDK2124501.1 hypothetical protein [Parachitinimonas caeni]